MIAWLRWWLGYMPELEPLSEREAAERLTPHKSSAIVEITPMNKGRS